MAGNWIKWVKGLTKRREVIVLARKLNVSCREAACACMEMWEWADDETEDGHIKGATAADIDLQFGIPGFAVALESPEVGWLRVNSQGLTFPRWDRHNGESAKRRANDAAKKRQQRDLGAGQASRKKRDKRPENVPKEPGPDERRREKTRGEKNIQSREDRSADRSAPPDSAATGPPSSPDRSDQSPRSSPPGRSRVNFLVREGEEPFDLSGVDWAAIVAMAERAAKRVPPRTEDDRRAWLRYAVMADSMFSEAWLIGAAEIVEHAKETKLTRQAHFVAVLQSTAAELQDGVNPEMFNAIARRVEIPLEIWKSNVLPVGPRHGNGKARY